MNWNDLKYFLAVRRHGTLSAAANTLAVNQTTVSRRLKRLEQQTHQKLLHRSGASFSLTPDGIRFAGYAEKVEDAVQHLESSLGPTLSVQGPLKITAVESLINQIFLPALPAFHEKHPHIELNLFGSSTNLEIGRLEADIGVRLARPTSGRMITVKLGTLGFAVYGTAVMADKVRKTGPQNVPWALMDTAFETLPEMQWVHTSYPDIPILFRSHSATTLAQFIGQGQAIAILPCFLGDQQEDLQRVTGSPPVLYREAWLVCHQDLFEAPRVKAGITWLKSIFNEQRKQLNGN